MTKIFVQDIVPAGKRSIRNIPLPNNKSMPVVEKEMPSEDEQPKKKSPKTEQKYDKPPTRPGTKRKFSGFGMWFAGIVVLLVVIYAASFMFVSATATITPKEINTPISVAGKAIADATDGTLPYTLVTLSREGSKEVPAGSEEKVERKASGKIIIYNTTPDAQTLITNTRFQSPAGLIFRIPAQISVPGQKTVNGVTTPGSISVTVTADAPGEQYNIGLSDFTIPGFKDDPKYLKFSAKSDPASPISGGYIGTVRKVTPTDTAAAKISIETQLKNELLTSLDGQIPDTHVLFRSAATFSFEELPQASGDAAGTAVVREKGSVYGILFDKNELSKYLALRLTDVGQKDVTIKNIDTLNFVLDDMSNFNPSTTKEISFKLDGNANFVWNIDREAVAQSLVGQKRANIRAILANYESVDRANVVIQPFWILSLPKNPAKIQVEIDTTR